MEQATHSLNIWSCSVDHDEMDHETALILRILVPPLTVLAGFPVEALKESITWLFCPCSQMLPSESF